MLPDPLLVAASAPNPAYSLAVIRSDGYGSERIDAPTGIVMKINHERGKQRNRHYVQVTSDVDAVSPYTGLTSKQTASVSLSVTVPPFGFDETAMVNLIKTLIDTLADADFTSVNFLQFQS